MKIKLSKNQWNFIGKKAGWAKAAQNMRIQDMENPSEEEQLAAVRENGLSIRYINNPSKAVKSEAIKQNPEAAKYIVN